MLNLTEMVHLVFRNILILLCVLFYSCQSNKKDTAMNKNDNKIDNCKVIDSLVNENYTITSKIDYFKMTAYSTNLSFKEEDHVFAIKKDNKIVNILECSCYGIYRTRLIKKYSDKYYIENRVIENKESGEIDYITIYYSLENIILTVVTKNTFSNEPVNAYLKDVFVVDNNFVNRYSYIYNSDFHIKNKNLLLSEKELTSLDDNSVKKMFFNRNNVKKYQFVNDNFAEKDTHISPLFLLPDPR